MLFQQPEETRDKGGYGAVGREAGREASGLRREGEDKVCGSRPLRDQLIGSALHRESLGLPRPVKCPAA